MSLRFFSSILRRSLFTLVLLGVISACAGKQEKASCDQRDWYETGRRDGSQGATLDRLVGYKKECGNQFNSFSETIYTNGRNSGLVEYCAPENSYELGRVGIAYMYVCPSISEPEFLTGYRRGQAARKLEIENQKLDVEIDMLLAKLNIEQSNYARREMASTLEDLRRARAKNDRDLNKYSN
jgi:hypothetical protein